MREAVAATFTALARGHEPPAPSLPALGDAVVDAMDHAALGPAR
jgi:hypothetical protein